MGLELGAGLLPYSGRELLSKTWATEMAFPFLKELAHSTLKTNEIFGG